VKDLHALTRTIAPTPGQTLLLRTALHERESAAAAWNTWRQSTLDARRALGHRRTGARRLLPLLHAAVERHDLPADKELLTYLRTAAARDEMRYATYQRVFREAIATLERSGFTFLVLKGAALGETVYPRPERRHSHDIDLLTSTADLFRAGDALAGAGFTRDKNQLGTGREHIQLRHASGLPVALHANAFRIPLYTLPLEVLWARSERTPVAGVLCRVPCADDMLIHVCGHAATCQSRRGLTWVVDGWYLLGGAHDLSWPRIQETAAGSRLALPLGAAFEYLRTELDARVPEEVLTSMANRAHASGSMERSIAFFAAQAGAWPKVKALCGMSSARGRWAVIRWLLVPRWPYIRWAYEPGNPLVHLFYWLGHPFRFVTDCCRRLLFPKT